MYLYTVSSTKTAFLLFFTFYILDILNVKKPPLNRSNSKQKASDETASLHENLTHTQTIQTCVEVHSVHNLKTII